MNVRSYYDAGNFREVPLFTELPKFIQKATDAGAKKATSEYAAYGFCSVSDRVDGTRDHTRSIVINNASDCFRRPDFCLLSAYG